MERLPRKIPTALARLGLVPALMALGFVLEAAPAFAQATARSSWIFAYTLSSPSGDVKVFRGGRSIEPVYSGMPLRPGDSIELGRSATAWVNCPGGRGRAKRGRRVGLGAICPQLQIGQTERGGNELIGIVNGEFEAQTLVFASGGGLSWPAVPGATEYRAEIFSQDPSQFGGDRPENLVWSVDAPSTDIVYGGDGLDPGEIYYLRATALDVSNAEPYVLKLQTMSTSDLDVFVARFQGVLRDESLSNREKGEQLIDVHTGLNSSLEAPQVWLEALPLVKSFQEPDNWAMQLRLADVYFHLNRLDEAQTLAEEVLQATGDDRLEGAIARELLGKVAFARYDASEGLEWLQSAQAQYEALGADELAARINAALN
ncbi:MAG: tetratricopeptide repeat protein [Cyanobacteria bacterium P01_F01_bin.153]